MGKLSAVWRETNHRYRLVAHQCGNCKKMYFPPRDICPDCHRESIGKMKEKQLSGNGRIESFTIVHDAPSAFARQRPYVLALVKLDEGPILTAQIVDSDSSELEAGRKVRAVFRKIREDGKGGIIQYGYKFVLE